MKIKFSCRSCGKIYIVDSQYAGKKAKCKNCGNVIQVPIQKQNTLPQSDFKQSQRNVKEINRPLNKQISVKSIIIVSIIIVLLLFGYFSWQIFKNRPQYALMQIRNSVNTSNRLKFEKYVDVNKFCQNFVDELLDGFTKVNFLDNQNKSGWEALGIMIGKQFIDNIKPSLVSSFESAIIKAVTAGDMNKIWENMPSDTLDTNISTNKFMESSGLTDESFYSIGKIERYEKKAYIPITIKHKEMDTSFTIRIEMTKMNNFWKVVGIEDLSEYIVDLSNLQKSFIEKANINIKKYLSSFLEIGRFSKREIGESYWGPKYIHLKYQIQNKSNRTIKTGLIRSSLPPSSDENQLDFAIMNSIASNGFGFAENILEYNSFIDWHKIVRNISSEKLKPELVYIVTYENGKLDTTYTIGNWSEYLSLSDKFK